MIRASAPGKAVLSGEYAVLEGANAIAVAVNRRARVTVTESGDDFHRISAPGYMQGSWLFTVSDGGEFNWREALPEASAFALVEEIFRLFDCAYTPLSIDIDTRAFCDTASGHKIGLGSSAAVAVTLTAALQKFAADDRDCRRFACLAHERFQHGRGSGIDVAASHDGGLICYRRTVRHSRRVNRPSGRRRQYTIRSRRLDWPDGLHFRFLWSGKAASTAGKLVKLGDNLQARLHRDALNVLVAKAQDVATAWMFGEARRILEAYPAYIDALERFSSAHDLGIFDGGHEDLVRAAAGSEVVYKPCGAGGGDIGIVLGACEHDVGEFCEQARQHGFSILDLAVDEQGVMFAE